MAVRAETVIEGRVRTPEHEVLFGVLNYFLKTIGETQAFGPNEIRIKFEPEASSPVSAYMQIHQGTLPALSLRFSPINGFPQGWKEFHRQVGIKLEEAIRRTRGANIQGVTHLLDPEDANGVVSQGRGNEELKFFDVRVAKPSYIQI